MEQCIRWWSRSPKGRCDFGGGGAHCDAALCHNSLTTRCCGVVDEVHYCFVRTVPTRVWPDSPTGCLPPWEKSAVYSWLACCRCCCRSDTDDDRRRAVSPRPAASRHESSRTHQLALYRRRRTQLRARTGYVTLHPGWLGSRVVSVLDSGAEGPGFKSQPRRCRITVLGKLFTPIVPLFTKQRNS